MNKKCCIVFLFLLGIIGLNAQQAHVNLDWAPQRNDKGLRPFMANTVSPEVHDDHSVTFRVLAPDVGEIFLSGSILRALKSEKPLPFTKGKDGI